MERFSRVLEHSAIVTMLLINQYRWFWRTYQKALRAPYEWDHEMCVMFN